MTALKSARVAFHPTTKASGLSRSRPTKYFCPTMADPTIDQQQSQQLEQLQAEVSELKTIVQSNRRVFVKELSEQFTRFAGLGLVGVAAVILFNSLSPESRQKQAEAWLDKLGYIVLAMGGVTTFSPAIYAKFQQGKSDDTTGT